MTIMPRSAIEINFDIPKNPTHEQMESTLYYAEAWTPHLDEEKEVTVLSFADIKEYFNSWDQYRDFCDIYYDGVDSDASRVAYADDHFATVYDYITSCLHWYGGAFWPVTIHKKEED